MLRLSSSLLPRARSAAALSRSYGLIPMVIAHTSQSESAYDIFAQLVKERVDNYGGIFSFEALKICLEVICLVCDTEQRVTEVCTKCGVKMGEWFCEICKFTTTLRKDSFTVMIAVFVELEGRIISSIVKHVDSIDITSNEAVLRTTQEEADDPHILSREENDIITMNTIRYNNKGRFLLMGVGALRDTCTLSSTGSSPSFTSTGSSARTLPR
ncbi:uncharacterized protein A4U43_C05F15950 [Asparagus officinalis]|uniref:Uncharacterized protein n=1 Tax=Asparagus officinalis TaxID=4686 RepID=A0A5P1ESZ1_ASPOF|nr:uncharacterized protein A4U43_C05F15950 [Asparagus officinalis]